MTDLRDVAWLDHVLDAKDAGEDPSRREASSWLRTSVREWLALASTDDSNSCGHAGTPGHESIYLEPRFAAALCDLCALGFIGRQPATTCERCGETKVEAPTYLALVGDRMFALVPLCRECALLEGLTPPA